MRAVSIRHRQRDGRRDDPRADGTRVVGWVAGRRGEGGDRRVCGDGRVGDGVCVCHARRARAAGAPADGKGGAGRVDGQLQGGGHDGGHDGGGRAAAVGVALGDGLDDV